MRNFPDLTLVIPAKENKKNIEYILKQLKSYNLKKIIILDSKKFFYKNTKDTFYYIQNKRGYGSAIIEGILKVKTKFFCIYNADGSFSPEELNKMHNNLKKNDFVFGSRYKKGGYSEDDTLITKLGNFFFSKIGQFFFALKLDDILYTYVMGDTEKIKKLKMTSHDFCFCIELPIKIKMKNYKYTSIPSYERLRYSGVKKVNEIKDGFKILFKMIYFFFKKKY
jgi:hypothetical protein